MAAFTGRVSLRVPRSVELKDGWIAAFEGDGLIGGVEEKTIYKRKSADSSILPEFLEIRDTQGALMFARRYGFLNRHRRQKSQTMNPKPVEIEPGWYAERYDYWLQMVQLYRAWEMLATAIDRDDGKSAQTRQAYVTFLNHSLGLEFQSVALAPSLAWDHKRWSWSLELSTYQEEGGHVLVGAGAALLLFFMRRRLYSPDDDHAVCSLCVLEYRLERRPAASRKNYCQVCRGSKEMWRRLKVAQRARTSA